ncbi:hypothetical protein [Escherichia coli]|uniref:hypothetical protein n=1 Tax=Escherichia coli TaxID=562 RepID=UPI0032DA99C8
MKLKEEEDEEDEKKAPLSLSLSCESAKEEEQGIKGINWPLGIHLLSKNKKGKGTKHV